MLTFFEGVKSYSTSNRYHLIDEPACHQPSVRSSVEAMKGGSRSAPSHLTPNPEGSFFSASPGA